MLTLKIVPKENLCKCLGFGKIIILNSLDNQLKNLIPQEIKSSELLLHHLESGYVLYHKYMTEYLNKTGLNITSNLQVNLTYLFFIRFLLS